MSDQDEVVVAATRLHVVRGNVDEDELVALVAGVVAYASAAASHEEDHPWSPTSAWMDRSRSMRGRKVDVLGHGDAAWRHSLR